MARWRGLPPLWRDRPGDQAADRRGMARASAKPGLASGNAMKRNAASSLRSRSGPFSSMAVSRSTRCYRPSTCFAAPRRAFPRTSYTACLGITYKAAWFLSHRIREAMRDGTLAPMGGAGGIVEVDETYIGRLEGAEASIRRRLPPQEHGGDAGRARRLRPQLPYRRALRSASIVPIVRANIRRESKLMTDAAQHYRNVPQGICAPWHGQA